MALFNYSSSYDKIKSYIGKTNSDAEWLRIYISPDAAGGGHLITHGIDLIPTYGTTDGKRGLVPVNEKTLASSFLRGDGWQNIYSASAYNSLTTDAAKTEYLQNALVNASDIKSWIDESFQAQDALRYKGTITINGTTVSGLPTSCEVGDVYKVSCTDGQEHTLLGQVVSSGDMLIAIADSTSANNDSTVWSYVQDNVEHLVQNTVNGNTYNIYEQSDTAFTIYGPTTATKTTGGGDFLISSASGAPVWMNQSELNIASADKVNHSLTLDNVGLVFSGLGTADSKSYNGSADRVIALAKATTSTLGGVEIDDGTKSEMYNSSSNTAKTAYPTVTIDSSNGMIYLTKANIVNALGYEPGNVLSNINGVVVTSTATGTASADTTNPFINLLAKDSGGGYSVAASYQLVGGEGISVANTSAAVMISQLVATSSTLGGIKIGYTSVDALKKYAVELDSNNQAFVNVPWISDEFDVATNSWGGSGTSTYALGLVPKLVDKVTTADSTVARTTYLLGSDAKWYQLPSTAFVGTWRSIKINGTQILDNKTTEDGGLPLNLSASTDTDNHVTLTAVQASGNYTGEVVIKSTWRDVLVNTIENSTLKTAQSIGNNTISFGNSDCIYMTATTTGTTTEVVADIVWYDIDADEIQKVLA